MNNVKIFCVLLIAYCMSSCAQMYSFYQVFESKPVNQETNFTEKNGGLLYEDEFCNVMYHFWEEGGSASFKFYNKTDSIIYIDLKKSFFIKNGVAYNYFLNREWGYTTHSTYNNHNWSQINTNAYNNISISTSSITNNPSKYIVYKETDLVAIPPQSVKFISEYKINDILYIDCDLYRFPADKATITFTDDNSPLVFSNYITYHVGTTGNEKVVNNQFYVSSVTNYSAPSAIMFIEREKECNNKKNTTNENTPTFKLYDKYWQVEGTNTSYSFYLKYNINSKKQLYKRGTRYYYNTNYDAYVKSESEVSVGNPRLPQFLAPTF